MLDIEGTTTPVSFVYDTLFPFARRHLRAYLRERADSEEVNEAVALLRAETPGAAASSDDLAGYLEWLMDRDRKSPGLKLVQGHIWERGYRDGTLRGEVYPDVRPAFERWHAAHVPIAIYSSGSVLAQQLIFGHSTAGDLTPFIDFYFDTAVGPKQSRESYEHIAAAMKQPPAALLFVSDVAAELDAARAAGFQTRLCVRSGDLPPDAISSFDQLP